MSLRTRKLVGRACLGLCLTLPGLVGLAAEMPAARRPTNSTDERRQRSIEEVIVTAQKREERLIDVPISIVAMSDDELEKRQVTSLEDLAMAAPGLAIQNNGSHQRRITLRGVGNTYGGSALVGLYLDEVAVSSATAPAGVGAQGQVDLRTYDLERVEVLRGPQGTLYGEGSVGGTVRFLTKNPVLDRFAMHANVGASYTEDGAPGERIDGALNIPLIESELGLRIAGEYNHEGGWIDQPAASKDDFNGENLMNVRVKGLWQPSPQFTANVIAIIHRNNGSIDSGEDSDGNITQTFNFTTTPAVEDDYDLYNLTLTYDFSAMQVLSSSSYVETDKEVRNFFMRFQFTEPGTPRFHFNSPFRTLSSEIFSQELRLTSRASEPWKWTIGGFYRDTKSRFFNSSLFGTQEAPFGPLFTSDSRLASQAWAAFGDVSYGLTDRLTIGAGLRYFEDEQESADSNIFTPVPILHGDTFSSVNPRFYAQLKLSDNINTYASAAKGFRAGGTNGPDIPAFDPESVWTYELGTKMSLLEGRLSADAGVFYSEYGDYQILGSRFVNQQLIGFVSNAGDAWIKGVEWALAWRPAEQWLFSLNGNFVDTEFTEIRATSTSHIAGDPLDHVPDYAYTVSTQRDFNWSSRAGFVRLDYNEQGPMFYRARSIGPWYVQESDTINMLNLHIGIQWSPNLSLDIFGQNLLNDRDFTNPFSMDDLGARSRPRTYGIGFGVTFD
jgi:iron complex outermembrane recepter protein